MQNEVVGHVTERSEARPAGDASSVQLAPPSDVRATADPPATQSLSDAHATSETEPTSAGRVAGDQCRPASVVTRTKGVVGELPWALATPPAEIQLVTVEQVMALNHPRATLSRSCQVPPPSELAMMNAGPEPYAAPPTASHWFALGQSTSFRVPTPAGSDPLVHLGESTGAVDDVEVLSGGAVSETALVVVDDAAPPSG
jgi:hypothetical protein